MAAALSLACGPRCGCAGFAFASASRIPPLARRGHRALAFASANGAPATVEGVFAAGDVSLQSGAVFRDVRVAYEIHGTMNADKSNVILVSLALRS